jgi:hypothetical protein
VTVGRNLRRELESLELWLEPGHASLLWLY